MKTTAKVRVLRPFFVKGERVEVDAVVEMDAADARDVIGANKAVALDPANLDAAANEAARIANEAAAKIEKAGQRAPATTPWIRRIA